MRSKLPAESGFSRCKDAIKSPCQPSATLPPWGGVVYEGLCRRSDRSRVPGHSLGRGDPGHTRGSARRTARARLGYCARTLQPRRPPLEGLRPCRVACAGRPAGAPGGRSKPRRRIARTAGRGSAAPRWRLGALSGRGKRGASRSVRAVGSAGARHYVWSPEEPLGRSLQMVGSPAIITRQAWGADERIRRDSPRFARTLTTAVVHHTAGGNPRRRPSRRPSCAGSTCTTCGATVGTTLATTSSSTDSARSSRADTGASSAT